MVDARRKLEVLQRLAAEVDGSPDLLYLIGFMTGRLERVHFVRSIEGASVGVRIAAGRRRLWPGLPFHGEVRGVPVPGPAAMVSALAESDDEIFLRVESDALAGREEFETLVAANPSEAWATESPAERADEIHRAIDRSLDIYRECRRLLDEGDPERQPELERFIEMARQEIESLRRGLANL